MTLRKLALWGACVLAPLASHAQNGEFTKPWDDGNRAIVIDPYEGNDKLDWDEIAKDKRVVAIIHRATQGMETDAKYQERKAEALKRGYLWGSYHLGRPGDPIAQAKFYLGFTGPTDNEVIALDIEGTSSRDMSLADAKAFIDYVAQQTGRYPVFYTNHSTTRLITEQARGKATVFSKTPLWYARYLSKVTDFPKGVWTTYALWQFSSEQNCKQTGKCLYNVPGTDRYMDINVFYGSPEELKARWPFRSPTVEAQN